MDIFKTGENGEKVNLSDSITAEIRHLPAIGEPDKRCVGVRLFYHENELLAFGNSDKEIAHDDLAAIADEANNVVIGKTIEEAVDRLQKSKVRHKQRIEDANDTLGAIVDATYANLLK